MSDLIERLRREGYTIGGWDDALSELEAQQAEIAEIKTALAATAEAAATHLKNKIAADATQAAEITRLRGHVENLCCLLDVIKEYWIDYDHVFTTGVGEARAELEQKP